MREPISSFGTPWDGETWSCSQCGETGPDRDDHRIGSCPARPRGMHRLRTRARELRRLADEVEAAARKSA